MRKYANTASNNPLLKLNPNPNPNPYQNPSFSRQLYVPTRQSKGSVAPSVSDDTASPPRKSMSLNETKDSESRGGHVTFNLAAFSRHELADLKKRLISELEQVRNLLTRIDSEDFGSRSGYLASKPPPLQLNDVVDSPKHKEKRTPKANQAYPSSEFLTAGKTKKAGPKSSGTKRPNPFGSGKDLKRPALDHPATEKLNAIMMKRCAQILSKLMKHKFGWVFNTPVDTVKLGLHDYHKIIKAPMDLGTVKSNLDKNIYSSPLDFAADVRLTFKNALAYNPKGTDVNLMASQLLSLFDEMFNPAYHKFAAEQRRVSTTIQESRPRVSTQQPQRLASGPVPVAIAKKSETLPLPAPPQPMPAPVLVPAPKARPVKLPKPKAKDLNKREMSFEEKAKLGVSLQNLPQEKMGQFVQIIRKRNGHLAQEDDEIELDIETIDTETLWELDRFVTYHKKMVSKLKRQGLFIQNNSNTQVSAETQIGNKVIIMMALQCCASRAMGFLFLFLKLDFEWYGRCWF